MKVFWGLLVLGLTVGFLLPPFQGPDESMHWWSALNRAPISQRELCSLDKALPSYFETTRIIWHSDERFKGRLLLGGGHEVASTCEEQAASYSNWFSYPSVQLSRVLISLFPSTLGTSVVKFYLARLLGGLAFILLFIVYWKKTSDTLSLVFVSSPLLMQQVFTISGDTVVLLYFMLYLTMAVGSSSERRHRALALTLLVIAGIGAASNKPTLVPVFFVLSIYEFLKARWEFAWIHLGAAIYAVVFPLLDRSTVGAIVTTDINPSAQVAYVLDNPWGSFRALWRVVRAALAPESWTGPLGFLEAPLLRIFSILWAGVLLLCLVRSFWRLRSGSRVRVCLALAGVLGSTFLSALVMYVVFTPVGHYQVLGMQSRYVFPAVLAAFFMIDSADDRRGSRDVFRGLAQSLPWLSALFAAQALLYRYWLS
jgi:uncharacterized membrane protein